MSDLGKMQQEADEDCETILNLSDENAIIDLESISQSLQLFGAKISCQRAILARNLAEETLKRAIEANQLLAKCNVGNTDEKTDAPLEDVSDTDSTDTVIITPTIPQLDTREITYQAGPLYKMPNLSACDGKTFGTRHRELLLLSKKIMRPYGIPMYEFSTSWKTGRAFCAFIHSYRPDLIDEKYLKCKSPKETLKYVEPIANSLGAHFDGNLTEWLLHRRPGYIKIYFFRISIVFVFRGDERPPPNTSKRYD